jgi:hypothetical protein
VKSGLIAQGDGTERGKATLQKNPTFEQETGQLRDSSIGAHRLNGAGVDARKIIFLSSKPAISYVLLYTVSP